MKMKRQNMLKILLLGEPRVGKTSIARRFLGQKFSPEYVETLGVNISYIDFETDRGDQYKLLFWDLAGSEKFKIMRKSYFDGATGIILVWDVTRGPPDIDELLQWFDGIDPDRLEDLSVAVVANKIDLINDRDIPQLAPLLEKRLNIWSAVDLQTSALTGEGIDDALRWVVRDASFHMKKKKAFADSVFDTQNYPVAAFKLGDEGVDALFMDDIKLYHIPERELHNYLVNLGIKISFATGQGQTYTTGITNLLEGEEGNKHRLLIYSYRLRDEEIKDKRLRNNFLQFVIFIPKQFAEYFVSFQNVESLLDEYYSQFERVSELNFSHMLEIRDRVIERFRELSNL